MPNIFGSMSPPGKTGDLTAYEPSWREQIGYGIANLLGSMGMTNYGAQDLGRKTANVTDILNPIQGALTVGNDMYRAAKAGNADEFKLATLGLIPGMGGKGRMVKDAIVEGVEQVAQKGIRAFHGSPHNFEQFKLDNIGTGEGAQAQGYGLYFTNSERLANSYRKANPEIHKGPGHMYEVNIDADPAMFLDRDLPLGEQPQPVQDAVLGVRGSAARSEYEKRGLSPEVVEQYLANGTGAASSRTGKQLIENLEGTMGPERAAQALREAGIPGIRYGADKTTKNTNYVVFDDKLISIVKKYGIAAAIGSGLVSQQMADQMQAQGDI